MNDESIVIIQNDIKYIRKALDNLKDGMKDDREEFESRLRALEDWRLVFVARFSIYSAIALVIGSFVAQLVLSYISKVF